MELVFISKNLKNRFRWLSIVSKWSLSHRKLCFRQLRPQFQGAPSHRNWRFYYEKSSFSNDDSERLENHFAKRKKVFVSNMSKNNNLSQFLYRCHILRESNSSLRPNFRISQFPCFTHVFEIQMSGKSKQISNK